MAAALIFLASAAFWGSSDVAETLAQQARDIEGLKQTVNLLKQTVEAQSMALKLLSASQEKTRESSVPSGRASASRALSSASNIARLELSPFEGKNSRLQADATGELTVSAEDSVHLDTPIL